MTFKPVLNRAISFGTWRPQNAFVVVHKICFGGGTKCFHTLVTKPKFISVTSRGHWSFQSKLEFLSSFPRNAFCRFSYWNPDLYTPHIVGLRQWQSVLIWHVRTISAVWIESQIWTFQSINMLSPSFKAKRSRSQSPGQQNTFSVWVQEHTAGAAVMAVVPWSAFPLSFSSTGIHLADASIKRIGSRAFLEVLLPSCSKQLASLKAQAFFTKPHNPLNHRTISASSIPSID